jgi:DNA-binding NarL/FixJ family response regulator
MQGGTMTWQVRETAGTGTGEERQDFRERSERYCATRVLIVDDHRTLAELLSLSLQQEPDLDLVGCGTTAAEGLRLIDLHQPDVVLMDFSLPDQDGLCATRQILTSYPGIRVVMLTASTDPMLVVRAAAAGVCAFLPKSGGLAEILAALRTARPETMTVSPHLLAGLSPGARPQPDQQVVPPLTPREYAVLELLGHGYDSRRTARQLGITLNTCRGYVKSLLLKLGCHSQLEAVAKAHRLGLIGVAHRD